MPDNYAVVVTTINAPNRALRDLARGSGEFGADFVVVGDQKSPPDFRLEGCRYFDIAAQLETGLEFARLAPVKHYARKNIGYLLAMRGGADVIIETDDDNIPLPPFWDRRERHAEARPLGGADWTNVYRYFSDGVLWPRGLPLDRVATPPPKLPESLQTLDCPIQQGLADDNPDVDAIYRLVLPLPVKFDSAAPVALGEGSWCPFNSQNTTWWSDAFPLLYLPSCCSFRMTDIWRSFVAQKIAWLNGWSVLFHDATVFQERNEHNLMRDFEDEVPGYLNNDRIVRTLNVLPLVRGSAAMPDNLRTCYEALVAGGWVGRQELPLLDAWLNDLQALASNRG